MQNPNNPWMGKFRPNYQSMRNDPRQMQQAQQQSSTMQGFANMAPLLGTGLGGLAGALIGGIPTGGIGAAPGAGIGASIGGALGGAAGAGLSNLSQSLMDPQREREMKQEALMMALAGMR